MPLWQKTFKRTWTYSFGNQMKNKTNSCDEHIVYRYQRDTLQNPLYHINWHNNWNFSRRLQFVHFCFRPVKSSFISEADKNGPGKNIYTCISYMFSWCNHFNGNLLGSNKDFFLSTYFIWLLHITWRCKNEDGFRANVHDKQI